MALTAAQKRKAREKLARKRGVSASSISDSDLSAAIANSIITASDYGSSYDSCGSSYDSGSSYSSSDSGSCY